MTTLQEAAMTAERAAFFLQRFKNDEKMLGPNEQAAIDFALASLAQQGEQTTEPTDDQLVKGVKAMRLFVTNNNVADFKLGYMAALAAAPATFRKPSAKELAQRELEDAQRALLQAHSAAEYAASLAKYHTDRIKRLSAYVKEIA